MFDFDENAPITKKEMLQINRYIKKQNRLRAAAIKRKQDKLYKDIAFMFKKYEDKLNKKEAKIRPAGCFPQITLIKKNAITILEDNKEFIEVSVCFKVNASTKIHQLKITHYKP